MELIFETRMDIDCCDNLDELHQIQASITSKFSDKIKTISSLFKEEKFDQIKQHIQEATYVEKMLEEINAKEGHIKYALDK